jgi:glycosyl transferase, family 25
VSTETDVDLQDMLRHVPPMEISFDGDCTQAAGVDLCVAAINLPHRADRWQAISSRLAAVGLDKVIRVPAIEGARLSMDQIRAALGGSLENFEDPPSSHFKLTHPAVGCFLSHLAVWRWMLSAGIPRLLVLEDDAAPTPDFTPDRLRMAIGSLDRGSGFMLLGRIIMDGMAELPSGSELARIYFFNGTFAYLITPQACRTLIAGLAPPSGHVDHEISKLLVARRDTFAAHYVEPPLFDPDWSLRSDCYVPLTETSEADRALGDLFRSTRRLLEDDGRPLLPPYA